MKYIFIILILFSGAASAQVVQETNDSRASRRVIVKNGLLLPKVCNPTTAWPDLLNYNGNKGAIVFDSCNNKIKWWNGSFWDSTGASGGSGDYVDTIYRKPGQDSIFFTINGGAERAILDSLGSGSGAPIDSVYLRWNSTASSVYSANGGFAGNTASRFNIGIGRLTLDKTTTGGNSIAIGDSALSQINTIGDNSNIAIGYRSQSRANGTFNVSIGSYTLQNTTGNQITAIGYGVAQFGASTGATLVGFNAGGNNVGAATTAVGSNAASLATGTSITAIGNQALQNNAAATHNTALGASAGVVTTTGGDNVYVGSASQGAAGSLRNVLVGRLSGSSSLGSDNVAIGHSALNGNTNSSNVAVGWFAGRRSTGARLTLIGYSIAGQNAQPGLSGADNGYYGHRTAWFASSGAHNTAVGGTDAAYGLSTGSSNTFLGSEVTATQGAGSGTITGSNNIIIGRRATMPSVTSNDQIVLGVGGTSPYNAFTRFTGGGFLFNMTTSQVNTQTASTALEVNGTTGAVLFPRLTTTQRDALTATNGMVIYNTTTDKLQVYAAATWVDLH